MQMRGIIIGSSSKLNIYGLFYLYAGKDILLKLYFKGWICEDNYNQ
jgi:hypothetical protein